VELQQLQANVNAVLSEGRSLIHSSPVGVDTSDIELTVDTVGKLLTDINQLVILTDRQRHIQSDIHIPHESLGLDRVPDPNTVVVILDTGSLILNHLWPFKNSINRTVIYSDILW